jgi:hypothetical protein
MRAFQYCKAHPVTRARRSVDRAISSTHAWPRRNNLSRKLDHRRRQPAQSPSSLHSTQTFQSLFAQCWPRCSQVAAQSQGCLPLNAQTRGETGLGSAVPRPWLAPGSWSRVGVAVGRTRSRRACCLDIDQSTARKAPMPVPCSKINRRNHEPQGTARFHGWILGRKDHIPVHPTLATPDRQSLVTRMCLATTVATRPRLTSIVKLTQECLLVQATGHFSTKAGRPTPTPMGHRTATGCTTKRSSNLPRKIPSGSGV